MSKEDGSFPERFCKNVIYNVVDLMFFIAMDDPGVQKYRTTFITKDGIEVLYRPIRPDDDDKILEFYYSLSRETIYFRFFSGRKNVPISRIRRYTHIDYEKNFAMVVEYQDTIIGIGHYIITENLETAEMAVVMDDNWQQKGIGTHFLRYLISIAKERGIKHLTATVLLENYKILKTIEKLGFKFSKKLEEGDLLVEADI
ncbi:MAG: GNAT family N-acetyltransferase [Candidatus Helarchaeota archaeon]|nr:GNAT family N-acetyltransferase [Candidatus Helarchaeota archaeon]